MEEDGWEDNVLPGRRYGIADFINPERPDCRYVYDYGDNWRHRVVLEAVVAPEPGRTYPVCLEGERACPPEDVGGAAGYEDLLGILKDPGHERFDEMRRRVGDFDSEKFDPLKVIFPAPENGRSG
jgi:hypothetical protein